MSKMITPEELVDAVRRLLLTEHEDHLDEARKYADAFEIIAGAVAACCGGIVGSASQDSLCEEPWLVSIGLDEAVPADGGIWAKYDTDVQWIDGEEQC